MIRDSGPSLGQTLDQPINGPPHLPSPDVKLPDHPQEVAGQNPHLEPGLVGLEPLATGFVPPQSVLPFLDAVFDLGPAIVDLGSLAAGSLELVTTKPIQGKSSPRCHRW
jgi:hypothetical protein